jgi:acyl dehydratase
LAEYAGMTEAESPQSPDSAEAPEASEASEAAEPAAGDPGAGLLHFEDFAVGETVAFGAYPVTAEEIVAFAGEFDPQPFHLDEAAAADSLLGGLAASGWHSCAILMRMICDAFLNQAAGLGSPGVDEVKWLKPVRPGDVLSARRTCLEARASASRPEMGLVRFHYEVANQSGTTVMTWLVTQLFRRRPAMAETAPPPEPATDDADDDANGDTEGDTGGDAA